MQCEAEDRCLGAKSHSTMRGRAWGGEDGTSYV